MGRAVHVVPHPLRPPNRGLRLFRAEERARPAREGEARAAGCAGFTLVEILVAVAILGIAIVGIFGALSTFLQAGRINRSDADLNQVVRTYSDSLIGVTYVNCASSYASVTLPSGYAFSAGPTVRYWNGDNPATFAASCASDKGVQQISATVSQTASGQTQTLLVAKNSG